MYIFLNVINVIIILGKLLIFICYLRFKVISFFFYTRLKVCNGQKEAFPTP